jgi:DNA-binding HxlR family transcriptional regulator
VTGPRTYGDPCGMAKALDAIGERWALLIVRELTYGPRRFTDLRADLGASPNVLTQRLAEMEEAGVVERRTSGGAQYDLTDWGRALHPILVPLARWGMGSQDAPTGPLSPSALMLELETRFRPDMSMGREALAEIRLSGEVFSLTFGRDSLAITRARLPNPEVVIETDVPTLHAALLGRDLRPEYIRGDADLAGKLLGSFRLS